MNTIVGTIAADLPQGVELHNQIEENALRLKRLSPSGEPILNLPKPLDGDGGTKDEN